MAEHFCVRLAGQTNWIPLVSDGELVRDLEEAIRTACANYGDEWCELGNNEQSAMQGNKGIVRSTDDPNAKRYDVNASVYSLDGGASDGAYDLHHEGATPEEICASLLKVLKADWGLADCEGPFRLEINIGPQGSGDEL